MASIPNRAWLGVSQVSASVSNVLIVFAAAAFLPTSDIGAIGLAFSGYLIALAVVRGVVGEPALLNHAIGGNASEMASGALIVGTIVSLALLGPILAIDGNHSLALTVSVALTPILCVQDVLRYASFAQERPKGAAASDLAWVLGTAVTIAISYIARRVSVSGLVVGWSVAGTVAAVVICANMLGGWPRFRDLRRGWSSLFQWRRQRFNLSIDSIATSAVIQVAALQVTQFGGLAAGGVARIVQTAHGPATLLFSAMYVDGVWTANRNSRDPRLILRAALRMAISLATVSVIVSVVFVAVPAGLGRRLLGETFATSRGPMMMYAATQVAAAFGTAAVFALRLMGKSSTRIRLLWAVSVVLIVPLGAGWYGAGGYFAALTLANTVAAVLWWMRFRAGLRSAATKEPRNE